MVPGTDAPPSSLTPEERRRLDRLRDARGLAELRSITGSDGLHEAYFDAKAEWSTLRAKELAGEPERPGLPGDAVTVDGREFVVHGITHAGTEAERDVVRAGVAELLEAGASVYTEQGIRPMYFRDFPEVCEMDDYRWAIAECKRRELDSHVEDLQVDEFGGISEDVDSISSRFQDAVFSLIDSGSEFYGRAFADALGDVASSFLDSHETAATAEDYTSFTLSRAAAEDPDRLRELQHYYHRRFLPQPVEREWLRRHDPELELVTHARNQRMVEYAVYHADGEGPVHLIVGAAHQPGVVYYLERVRDGELTVEGFELAE